METILLDYTAPFHVLSLLLPLIAPTRSTHSSLRIEFPSPRRLEHKQHFRLDPQSLCEHHPHTPDPFFA